MSFIQFSVETRVGTRTLKVSFTYEENYEVRLYETTRGISSEDIIEVFPKKPNSKQIEGLLRKNGCVLSIMGPGVLPRMLTQLP